MMSLTHALKKLPKSKIHMSSWPSTVIIIAVFLCGLEGLLTPTPASREVYTDGKIHVMWYFKQMAKQLEFDEAMNQAKRSVDVSTTTWNRSFHDNIDKLEFCEIGESTHIKPEPADKVIHVDENTISKNVEACEDFLFRKNFLANEGLHREKRALDFRATYPGTKWCGRGNIAESYDDIGKRRKIDLCCREHDHCPENIQPGQSRGGLTNKSFKPMFPCWCEERLKRCLSKINNMHSNAIGVGYFNVLTNKCYVSQGNKLKLKKSRSYSPCFRIGFFSRLFNGRKC